MRARYEAFISVHGGHYIKIFFFFRDKLSDSWFKTSIYLFKSINYINDRVAQDHDILNIAIRSSLDCDSLNA